MAKEQSSAYQISEFAISNLSKVVWSNIIGKAPKDNLEKYCQSEYAMKLVSVCLGISFASVGFKDKAENILFKSIFKALTPKTISQLSLAIEKSITQYKKQYVKLSKDGISSKDAHDKAIEQSLGLLVTEILRFEIRNFVAGAVPKVDKTQDLLSVAVPRVADIHDPRSVAAPEIAGIPDLLSAAAPKVSGISELLSVASRSFAIRTMSEPAVGVIRELYNFGYDLQKKDFSVTELIAALQKGFLQGIETSLFLEPGTFHVDKVDKDQKMIEEGKAEKRARVVAALLAKAKEAPLKGKNLSTDDPPITPAPTPKLGMHDDGLRKRPRRGS